MEQGSRPDFIPLGPREPSKKKDVIEHYDDRRHWPSDDEIQGNKIIALRKEKKRLNAMTNGLKSDDPAMRLAMKRILEIESQIDKLESGGRLSTAL